MPAGRFDGLLIDFYGTVSAGDRDAVERACAKVVEACDLSLTPAEFALRWGERFFAMVDRSNHDAFRTLFECEKASLTETLRSIGSAADSAPFVDDLEAYWRDPPLHADAVEFLRTVDVPVCCVSNADTEPLRAAIKRHGLRFDAVVTSEMVRCYKPDPLIFREGLRQLGFGPDRVAHIGDSLHSDIAGASAVGLSTIWLRRENRIHDIGNCHSDRTIASFADIHAVIDRERSSTNRRSSDFLA